MDRRFGFLSLLAAALVCGAAQAGLLEAPASAEPQILPAEEAMRLQPPSWQNGQLSLRWDLAPGVYLYRDRLKFEVVEPSAYALGPVSLPEGEAHHDEHFGTVRILRGQAQAGFTPASKIAPSKVRVRYQGCAENLVCYPPQTVTLDVLDLSRRP